MHFSRSDFDSIIGSQETGFSYIKRLFVSFIPVIGSFGCEIVGDTMQSTMYASFASLLTLEVDQQ